MLAPTVQVREGGYKPRSIPEAQPSEAAEEPTPEATEDAPAPEVADTKVVVKSAKFVQIV